MINHHGYRRSYTPSCERALLTPWAYNSALSVPTFQVYQIVIVIFHDLSSVLRMRSYNSENHPALDIGRNQITVYKISTQGWMDMDIPAPIPPQPTRFLDRVRGFMRLRGMAYKTEKTYLFWIKRFIRFHGLQHPEVMGSTEVEAFLSHLVLQANASAATQRVALNALVFLYREFLGQPLNDLNFEHSRKPVKLPTVFSAKEARSVIHNLDGSQRGFWGSQSG